MRSVSHVLLSAGLLAVACRPPAAKSTSDLAQSQPRDAGADLAPTAGDLAPWIGADLAPPLETVSLCPDDQQMDNGTNTVLQVHASWRIDTATVSSASLVVQAGATAIPGTVSVSRQDLTFTPTAPLPANATLQASLGGDVHDTLGRPLWPGGKSWTFFTGAGAKPTVGFKFTPPISPYLGDHSISSAVARDGSQTIIAWSTASNIVATSLNADATDFINPLIVSHTDLGLSGVSVTAADGVATFGYEMSVNSPLVYWSRARDDWKAPPTDQLLTPDTGGSPSVAAAPGGALAIAWAYGDPTSVVTTHLITSSNSGATFSAPAALELGSTCPQVLYQNGRLVIAWLDEGTGAPGGGPFIKATVSTNNGASFGTTVKLADAPTGLGCPELVDGGNGDVLVLYSEGPFATPSIMLGRFTPSTSAVGQPIELYAADGLYHCAHLAASPSGKLVLGETSGMNAGSSWTSEVRTSDDLGKTFGPGTSTDVIDSLGACPMLTMTDDPTVTMAWQRDGFELLVSRGHPRRPCE